jgi:hypothetical protein
MTSSAEVSTQAPAIPEIVKRCVVALATVHRDLVGKFGEVEQPRIIPGCLGEFGLLVMEAPREDLKFNLASLDDDAIFETFQMRTDCISWTSASRKIWKVGQKLTLLDVFLLAFARTGGYKMSGYTFDLDEVLLICSVFDKKGVKLSKSPALCFFLNHYLGAHHSSTKYHKVFPHPQASTNWRKISESTLVDLKHLAPKTSKRLLEILVEDWASVGAESRERLGDPLIIDVVDKIACSEELKAHCAKHLRKVCGARCTLVDEIQNALETPPAKRIRV